MDLSVIIVNWNTRELLRQCLESVYRTSGDLATELIVVDNGSSDGSGAMVRDRFPLATLIENAENRGFASANNQAMGIAHGRYLLLLNSDTRVCAGAFTELVAFMEDAPAVGAVGPRLLNADGSLQPSCHPMLTPWREFWRLMFLERVRRLATYDMARWPTDRPHRVEVIKGACLLLRREALDQIGLLDERYFMYTEEVDLCYRLVLAGWELYWLPKALVIHYEGQSAKQIAESMYVQLYRSKVQFFRKYGGERRARLFKRLLRLAYWPRLTAAALGALLRPSATRRVRTIISLLCEILNM